MSGAADAEGDGRGEGDGREESDGSGDTLGSFMFGIAHVVFEKRSHGIMCPEAVALEVMGR